MTVPTEVILDHRKRYPKATFHELARMIGTSYGDVQRTIAAHEPRRPRDVIGPKPFKKIPFAGSRGRQW